MRRILNLPAFLLLFVAAMCITSCADDGPVGPGNEDGPTVTLLSSNAVDALPAEAVTIEFSASPGASPLNAVTVYEDGVKVPLERLQFNGVDANANATLLAGTDKEGLTWTTTVTAQSSAATTVLYGVEVTDESQLKESVIVSITTSALAPTLTGGGSLTPTFEQGTNNAVFRLSATQGTGLLTAIEVREDGLLVDPARLNWNDISMMAMGNPFGLSTDEADGFLAADGELAIDLADEVGVYVFDIILEDEFNLRDTVTYVVTTTLSGTPVEIRTDVLLNAAGPAGTGGLDLDTGMPTGTGNTSGANAEIRDNGINNLGAAVNWIRTISAMNGATIKYAVAGSGLPEGFTFGSVETKEELSGIYDNSTSDVIGENNSSSPVDVGDTFIVRKGSQYWLLLTKEVNIKTAVGDNSDNYVFDVKF